MIGSAEAAPKSTEAPKVVKSEAEGFDFDFSEANAAEEARRAAAEDLYKSDGTEFDFSEVNARQEAEYAAREAAQAEVQPLSPAKRKFGAQLVARLMKRS